MGNKGLLDRCIQTSAHKSSRHRSSIASSIRPCLRRQATSAAMLTQARSRLATALRRPALARNLCAPAVPLVDQVRADLAVMKAKISQKTVGGYMTEAFSAALSKGTVDPTLLSASMDFSDEARKVG